MISLKIATLNCRGLRYDPTDRRIIFDLAKQNKVDILMLQETNLRLQDEKKLSDEWAAGPCKFSSSADESLCAGLAVLSNDPNSRLENVLYDPDGKQMALDITIRGILSIWW